MQQVPLKVPLIDRSLYGNDTKYTKAVELAYVEVVKEYVKKNGTKNQLTLWYMPINPIFFEEPFCLQAYFYPRIFFWFPFDWELKRVPKRCIHCGRMDVHKDEFYYRLVCDETDNYYVLSQRWKCQNRNCKKLMSPTESDFLITLPREIPSLTTFRQLLCLSWTLD